MKPELIAKFVRSIYNTDAFIPLHEPTFSGNEKKYLIETIDSTFVSSVGKFVDKFEKQIEGYTGAVKAIATVNGTAALHLALHMAGVQRGDLVITQALTFVATCNTLHHMGANPIFCDVSSKGLGLCPKAVEEYLNQHARFDETGCYSIKTGQQIKAVMPMHTFGHPAQLDELLVICKKWNLVLVEDAAESLGSLYKGKHAGTVGDFSGVSFNGNKIITTGGGGMMLCRSEADGVRAKHVSTTSKVPHQYEFFHDEAGFNYRLPNLNAALGCAQMERIPEFLSSKRQLAERYQEFFRGSEFEFVMEPDYAESNYWLNAVLCPNEAQKELLLKKTNEAGVMTRPVWCLMNRLPMYSDALCGDLTVSEKVSSLLINLPSTPVLPRT
ncbi:MAG: LegC family aminotransferase [Neptuniibacter sp.]